jgi:hypothetical protein
MQMVMASRPKASWATRLAIKGPWRGAVMGLVLAEGNRAWCHNTEKNAFLASR